MRRALVAGLLVAVITGGAVANVAGEGWYSVSPDRYEVGVTSDMLGKQAVHATGRAGYSPSALQREIPLKAWQGKRVRLTLRLKDTGEVQGWVGVLLWNADGSGLTAGTQSNARGRDDWQSHNFVLDVPANADRLAIRIGMRGEGRGRRHGTVWVDDTALEAVGDGVRTSFTRRLIPAPYKNDGWLDSPSWVGTYW
jgi:hypothetical protein